MNIILTDSGLQKIVNAEQTGTAPVIISEIAFGKGQYTATASQTSLQSEIKRLPVISGGTDNDKTIHVAAQDYSSDAYSVYEFGLFLDDGTLLAVYSQSGTAILQKTISSVAQFECGIALEGVNIESVSFGEVAFSYPYANETNAGILELATNEEAQTGTDAQRAITPKTLQAVFATNERKGVLSIATSDEVITGLEKLKAVSPAALRALTATDSRKGLVELATNSETQIGSDSTRAVTPASLKSLTATPARSGIIAIATPTAAFAGTSNELAMTPFLTKQAFDYNLHGVEIDEDGRINNLSGSKPWSLYPSGRSVEMTARAGVCQKTLARFSDGVTSAVLNFFKSRGEEIRTNGSVVPGDIIGHIDFIADNGTMDYDGSTQGARVGFIQVMVHSDSTIDNTGNTNKALKGLVRIYAMEDGSNMTGKGLNVTSEYCSPSDNDFLTLGNSYNRWKSVYAVNGTIQTSDENLKTEIGEIPDALFKAWSKVQFFQYKLRNAVNEKGEKARFHIGLIAQRVVSAFESEGLDAYEYGLVCRDVDDEGNEILSLRYDECLALECAYERKRFEEILNKLSEGDR